MATQIILPPEVIHSLELEAQLEHIERLRARGGELKAFDLALKDIDGRLSLVRASEQAILPGLVPGYWNIRRRNDPPAIDSYLPIKDPDGGFMEPHSGVLEWLRGCDLQRDGALEELRKEHERIERARLRERELEQEGRMDEFATRYKAHAAPGVLFGDNHWTWRTAGRRGRRG